MQSPSDRPLSSLTQPTCVLVLQLMLFTFTASVLQLPVALAQDEAATADAEESPEESTELRVPEDASDEDLLKFAKDLTQTRKKSSEDVQAYLAKLEQIFPVAEEAVDQVIANAAAEEATAVQALQVKSRILSFYKYRKVEGIAEKAKSFLVALSDDSRPKVSAAAKDMLDRHTLEYWSDQGDEAKSEFLAEYIARILAKESVSETMSSLYSTSSSLKRAGDKDSLAKIIAEIVPKLKASDDSEMAAAARQFELMQILEGWKDHDEEFKTAFVDDYISTLQASEVTAETAKSLRMVTSLLKRADGKEAAEKITEVAIVELKKSSDPDVIQVLERMEGEIRRNNLLGNKMEIRGNLLDGTELDWSDYDGKVVLVDFWATWCGPCVAEIPHVLEEYARFHEQGFEVLAISLDTDKQACIDYMKSQELPWVSLIGEGDDGGWNHPMARYYGISGIPTAILIGKDGNVVSLNARGSELTKKLEEIFVAPEEQNDEAAEEPTAGVQAEAETAAG